ncbi:F-box protein At2g05970-like [Zingiber officinale]|uniref:F-box protein At2g05970-like n=1 Tax=Zingiber officinale TaxID=94328 RepID=UPI001C4AD040|nr:F-box protein At2g05970-like [Zingiber officinale]
MSTSWSEIPTDLLNLILSKLSIRDLICSAAVCSHWSSVVDKVRRSPGDQRPQIPWLVPEEQFLINGKSNNRNNYNFFSLAEGRVYDIPSPSRILKNVVGSSHGWLITVGKASVQLLNPITRVHINLPKFPTVDGRNLEAVKAVLSSDPSSGGDYFVAFVFDCPSMEEEFLFLLNAEDKKWKMITIGDYDYDDDYDYDYEYDDIAFHEGKLYAVLVSVELGEVIVAAYDLIMPDSTPTWTPVVALPDIDVTFYFLCASSEDLLLTRAVTDGPVENYINKLEVWKVDTEKCVVNTMNNLGEYSLFLSAASSLCIDTSSLPDLKSNSIYISIDLYDIGISDNLVYSMEDETYTSLSLPPLSSRKRRRFCKYLGGRWKDIPRYYFLPRTEKRVRPILVWFTPSIALHADPMET